MQGLKFDGDVIVVTGAAGGIGKALVLDLARRGARVVVNDLGGSTAGGESNAEMARAVAEEIRAAGGEAVADTNSTATPEGGAAIIQTGLEKWGRIDTVVANAAIVRDRYFEDMSIEDWDLLMAVNLRGVFCVTQPAYRQMKKQGSGRILAVTSSSGLSGGFGQANYCASKAGVVGLVRTIAFEGGRFGIKANLLAPGAMNTRLLNALTADDPLLVGRPESLSADMNSPHFKLLTAERVTPMSVALVHASCPVTGEIFGAAGGYYNRYWLGYSQGWVSDSLSPSAEDVAAHWDGIRGGHDPQVEAIGDTLSFSVPLLAKKLAGWVSRNGG
jgi:NAD(P)-dependent dehydrogenase (short-subunit alcohol dehydrogenase family)